MRVNQPNNPQAQRPETSRTGQAGKAGAPAESRDRERAAGNTPAPSLDVADAVSTSISPRSREFAQAKAVATSAPDVREEKIAELRRRIHDKSYKVDSDAVADRMVDEHLKMSGMS